MARGRCTAVPARPTECLDVPRWTRDAGPPLVPPCAAACHAQRAAWRRAPGTSRGRRGRMVKDRRRRGPEGGRALVLERGGTRPHVRGRRTPWPPMI
jgi:hypothetical protein